MPNNPENLLQVLQASSQGMPLNFRDYIELSLYHPQFGYYSKEKSRVGRSSESDFYTAESLGPVFSKLVLASIRDLLKQNDLSDYTFIEIAAEPGYCLMDFLEEDFLEERSFAKHKTIRLGEPLEIKEKKVVLFANEWLDAIPFHRIIFKENQWRERGVTVLPDGKLKEVLLEQLSDPVLKIKERLPSKASEGYEIDLSIDAESRVQSLLEADWEGLMLLFDYGRSWEELSAHKPNGTARTYLRHRQGQDLLEAPGDMDITYDVCWDSIQAIMRNLPKSKNQLKSQESFFVNHAQEAIKSIISTSAYSFSKEKQTLMELLHPSNMGQKFQVLYLLRN